MQEEVHARVPSQSGGPEGAHREGMGGDGPRLHNQYIQVLPTQEVIAAEGVTSSEWSASMWLYVTTQCFGVYVEYIHMLRLHLFVEMQRCTRTFCAHCS